MAVNRRALWLGATLIVAVIGVMVARSGDAPSSAPATRPAARASAQPVESAPPADVRLEALTTSRGEPTDIGRNPFRFQARPVTPAPTSEVPRLPVSGSEVGGPPAAPVPAGPPPPPPIALKFIGLVQKADGTKYAVLSDGKGPPISGTEGEEVQGRYKILKIGTESIEIAYIDGRGRRTIPLTGQ